MRFILERVSGPQIEPVTLAEAKRHIRQFANVTSEDADIETWIKVAREWVEDYTGRAMIDQTWRQTMWNGDAAVGAQRLGYSGTMPWLAFGGVTLRRSPVLEVLSVKTIDTQGVETEVDAATYALHGADSKWPGLSPLSPAGWNMMSHFSIEFRAGFADQTGSPTTGAEVVPDALKHAVKLILSSVDEHRGLFVVGQSVNELPMGLRWLLAGQKCDWGMA